MIYEYVVLDEAGQPTNEVIEQNFKVAERPDFITLPDNRTAKYIISKSSFILNGSGWYRDSYGLKK